MIIIEYSWTHSRLHLWFICYVDVHNLNCLPRLRVQHVYLVREHENSQVMIIKKSVQGLKKQNKKKHQTEWKE